MRKILIMLMTSGFILTCYSQPKLVVGVVVDQMRYDYIDRYWNKFGNDGFKRLVNEGYNCKNTNYNYVPTFTGPGHASIYTGVTPSVHGIVSNEWVDRKTGKKIYCTHDESMNSLGGTGSAGKMSPKNLLTTTIGEELKRSNANSSKVIAIALKDRSAVLPAGHNANAAYWFEASSGNWITSTYYMKELPAWVTEFNKKESAKKYLSQQWTTLLPIENYSESDADDSSCEEPFKGKESPVFPYDLSSLMKNNGGLGLIRNTPFGNTFTVDFVMETIKNEKLGKGAVTDFLCISFSSPDYIGHQFGPQSIEVEDCYLRLDRDMAGLFKFLDQWVGKNNVLVFLTADHGASEAVPCLQKKNIPAGVIHEKIIADSLKKFMLQVFKDTIPVIVNDFDVYFNRKKIELKKHNVPEMRNAAASYLIKLNGIQDAMTADEIQAEKFTLEKDSIRSKVKAGFNPERSGDVIFVLKPGWVEGYSKGTSHGSPYWYDTHVPLVWWGYNVKPGNSNNVISITQIAPTVSEMLKIPVPSGCISNPIKFTK